MKYNIKNKSKIRRRKQEGDNIEASNYNLRAEKLLPKILIWFTVGIWY